MKLNRELLLPSPTKHLPAPAKHKSRRSQGLEAKPGQITEAKEIQSRTIRFDAGDLLFVAHDAPRNPVSAMMT